MRRLKRNEEGVSPVIATILMVAITVVLAATLWMMLDTGDTSNMPLSAQISGEAGEGANVTVTFDSLQTPGTAAPENIEIVIETTAGEDTVWGNEFDIDEDWSLLNDDDEVRSSSELKFNVTKDPVEDMSGWSYGSDGDEFESITIFIEGYDGSRTIEDF